MFPITLIHNLSLVHVLNSAVHLELSTCTFPVDGALDEIIDDADDSINGADKL